MYSIALKAMWAGLALTALVASSHEGFAQLNSKWDKALLETEVTDVNISANNIEAACREIGTKYLLRANLFLSANSIENSGEFAFPTKKATGKELLGALIAAYPAYTYTQDQESGIIWIHPKDVRYPDILSQKVKVERAACQVPMLTGVLLPLCRALPSDISANLAAFGNFFWGPPPSKTFDYCMDLPAGIFTARKILNICCAWNATKAFSISPNKQGKVSIRPVNLFYARPAAPRIAAVKFWEMEIGNSMSYLPNYIPTAKDVSAAMGDVDPRKRWVGRTYLEAAWFNYSWAELMRNSVGAENEIWTATGMQAIDDRGSVEAESAIRAVLGLEPHAPRAEAYQSFSRAVSGFFPDYTNDLRNVTDPRLALIASLQFTKEKQDTSFLEKIVGKHKFSEAEIASVKPEICRLAHQSKEVLDKVKAMKLDAAGLSLGDLESTKLFTSEPERKQ